MSLPSYLPCMKNEKEVSFEVLKQYFINGYTYLEILEFLRVHHDCEISLSTLKRHFRRYSLVRRATVNNRSPLSDLRHGVEEELYGSGSGIGYRRIYKGLRLKGLIVRREDVRKEIKKIDPEGVALRRRRKLHRRRYFSSGPNYAWHIDGHDKLKPFGFSIHGCIDGFSRRLLWLEVAPSNKAPEIIAKYYLDTVTQIGGLPVKVKADDGTEHSLIEAIHIYLRSLNGNGDELESFSKISSPQNQRIESYWSILRRDRMGWWRRFLQDLVDLELFSSDDPVIVDCIRFCFMSLIRADLRSIAEEWNQHLISRSKNPTPTGRPDCMYYLPHLYDVTDQLQNVDLDEVEEFYPVVTVQIQDCSEEFKEFAETLMQAESINIPENPAQGLKLYTFLLSKVEEYS